MPLTEDLYPPLLARRSRVGMWLAQVHLRVRTIRLWLVHVRVQACERFLITHHQSTCTRWWT